MNSILTSTWTRALEFMKSCASASTAAEIGGSLVEFVALGNLEPIDIRLLVGVASHVLELLAHSALVADLWLASRQSMQGTDAYSLSNGMFLCLERDPVSLSSSIMKRVLTARQRFL